MIATMVFALLPLAAPGQAPPPPPAPTAIVIRRAAGLSADTARGAIEIVDVGHSPLSTMLSIVGRRDGPRWHVSYACAESSACAAGTDHRVADYALSAADSAAVDAILTALRGGEDPGGMAPSPLFIGGQLLVSIDDRGFRRDYRRAGVWGPLLGRLEGLMTGPAQASGRP